MYTDNKLLILAQCNISRAFIPLFFSILNSYIYITLTIQVLLTSRSKIRTILL